MYYDWAHGVENKGKSHIGVSVVRRLHSIRSIAHIHMFFYFYMFSESLLWLIAYGLHSRRSFLFLFYFVVFILDATHSHTSQSHIWIIHKGNIHGVTRTNQ